MNYYKIGSQHLSLSLLNQIQAEQTNLSLSEHAKNAILKCREFLDNKLKDTKCAIYGINTGFGFLQNVAIPEDKLIQLQHNLLLSHACGTGEKVPLEIIKIMLLLKIQSLAYGNSGISLSTVERLMLMYNENVLPVIFTQGSLGASGDLAPLAHLALPLIGEGEVWLNGEIHTAKDWLKSASLQPIELHSKEGLALINGTQFMAAYGIHILLRSKVLSDWADVIGALSADVFDCRIDPFKSLSHQIRPHKGQLKTAERIFNLLSGSDLQKKGFKQVQDPYSFRCMPQVHGASKDTIEYASSVFDIEVNSVTDNPNIFPEEDEIISAGNFHGQPLAFAFDFLCIALAELGSISERRTFQLISGQRGLPNFLVKNAGLNSGLMIPQYTAASIASENKQLSTPASVDSIVSSNGQEDHVSMGANAATKCLRVLNNTERILAIELMTAAQALEFRRPSKTSDILEKIISEYRKRVPVHENDRLLATDMRESVNFIKSFSI
ncbi:histidine ammonia-lyase [Daejeonella oryzae]|uniref:histidine ammonia-lyase n=1 Tax=Daejeonella oryzae TaxID=1122943 RepID=UPI00041F606B|nr:histidine ammonia-lyase [Daejeonella oryzae]